MNERTPLRPADDPPMAELELRAADGVRLHTREWHPEGEPRGAVVLIHGLGEHGGRHLAGSQALARSGFTVLAPDLRGHGQSTGPSGHADYQALLDDAGLLLEEAGRRVAGRPRFLYGHSLGGSLVINYALRYHPDIAGIVATGVLFRPAATLPRWKLLLGRLFYRLWPSFSMGNEVDPQALSREPAVARAYVTDPLVRRRVSARLGIGLLEAGEWALAHASELRLPLLLMHGADDRLTSPTASARFASLAGERCTFKLWEGCYHEIHNEAIRDEVFAAIVEWLDERVATG